MYNLKNTEIFFYTNSNEKLYKNLFSKVYNVNQLTKVMDP